MKKISWLFCLIIGFIASAQSQALILLDKNEIFKSPSDGMIVMDRYSFGKYNYTSEKYDTLKAEVQQLDSLLKTRDSVQAKISANYEEIIHNKEAQIDAYEKGFGEMENNLRSSIDKQNQLRVDYLKLEQKSKRTKKWRNAFLGAAVTAIGIIFLVK